MIHRQLPASFLHGNKWNLASAVWIQDGTPQAVNPDGPRCLRLAMWDVGTPSFGGTLAPVLPENVGHLAARGLSEAALHD